MTLQKIKQIIDEYHNRVYYGAALVVFLFAVSLFTSLADEVRDGDTQGFDKATLVFLRSNFASPSLDSAMLVLTDFGGVLAITVITTAMVAFMWHKRMFSRVAVLLLSMGGIAAAVTVLKLIIARERPSDVGSIISEASFSFPSGHSMGSMGLAVAVVLLLWPTKWRVYVLVAAAIYVLAIGFSRLYLGVHYPTDVLAGWLLGAGWVVAVYAIFKSNRRFKV